jgi:hypothetical protein
MWDETAVPRYFIANQKPLHSSNSYQIIKNDEEPSNVVQEQLRQATLFGVQRVLPGALSNAL